VRRDFTLRVEGCGEEGKKLELDFFTFEKYTSSSNLKSIAESQNHWVGRDTARLGEGRVRA
jgi:hypothetical protein